MLLLVTLLLAWTVAEGRSEVAAARAAGAAVLLLGRRLSSIATGVGTLYESTLFLADVEAFTGAYAELDSEPFNDPTGAVAVGELQAEHVSFTYPSGADPALREVSVTVRSGEMIALVREWVRQDDSGETARRLDPAD